jgi:hypothetical protein
MAGYGGYNWNCKFVLGVGDCQNDANSSLEGRRAAAAWGIFDSNNVASIVPPGNHDMTSVQDRVYCPNFAPGGPLSAGVRSGKSLWGAPLPGGGGGTSAWGGSYDDVNYYVTFAIGSVKLLVFSLEFFPRSAVLAWAKGIHDANLDKEVIVTTHGYLDHFGMQSTRASVNGPDSYAMPPSPASNSGDQQWANSFSTWSNLALILCGHFVWQRHHPAPAWFWQQVPIVSNSGRKQTVQQIFYNEQEQDSGSFYAGTGEPYDSPGPGSYCPANGSVVTPFDCAHLMAIVRRMSTAKWEAVAISTNSLLWRGGIGVPPSSTPITLFSVNAFSLRPSRENGGRRTGR